MRNPAHNQDPTFAGAVIMVVGIAVLAITSLLMVTALNAG